MWIAQSRLLSALPNIRHGFFGRTGGVSTGPYASLNVGLGSADAPEAVAENRSRVAHALGAEHLVTLRQVHGTEVVGVSAPLTADARPEGDALITTTPGLAIGALSADCVPILLVDASAGIVAAVHAGWKGARANIMAETVAAMERQGAKRGHILAAIGPCIAQDSYEVGDELRAQFPEADAHHFRPGAPGKFWFDVGGVVEARLAEEGLAGIERLRLDTYALNTRFYSYRRVTHEASRGDGGEKDYGRHVSAIALV